MAKKLRPGGVFVTQSGCAGLLNHKECFTTIHNTLAAVFEHVLPYSAEVPSFGGAWGWNLAFNTYAGDPDAGRSFVEMSAAAVDERLSTPGRVSADKVRRAALSRTTCATFGRSFPELPPLG